VNVNSFEELSGTTKEGNSSKVIKHQAGSDHFIAPPPILINSPGYGKARPPVGTCQARRSAPAKNDEGRVVYLTPELKVLLAGQIERVRALARRLGQIIPYLFPHLGKRLQGQRIKDFRYAWETACR
jgi:hypothetical protein